MKKDKKKNISIVENKGNILLLIAVLVVLFTILSYLSLFSIKNLLSTFPILQTLAIGNQDSWLLFFGSLFGGSLTLIALIITFQYTDKQRIDEKILNVMPICIGTVIHHDKVGQQLRDICQIEISNVSGNLAKNFKIESYIFETLLNVNDVQKTDIFSVNPDVLEKVSNIIPAGKSIEINPWIPTYKQLERDDHVEKVILKVVISYSDIFSLSKYELLFSVEFGLRLVQNKLNSYITEDGINHFVKEFYFLKESNIHK